MKKIFGNFKAINWRTLSIFVPISLAYPIIKSIVSNGDTLTILSDTLFIMSMILVVIGIVFIFYINGDFDISSFVARRSVNKNTKDFKEFKKDSEDERSKAFNYPLFFGLLYLLASIFIAYVLIK